MSQLPALCLDYGASRIGLAMTDPLGILAYPCGNLPHPGSNQAIIAEVSALVQKHAIASLVLGVPYRIDGSIGSKAEEVLQLMEEFKKALSIPVYGVDESYTTVQAAEKLRAAGRKAKQQKQLIDQQAAVEILGYWLQQQGY